MAADEPRPRDEETGDDKPSRKAFLLRLSPELHAELRRWAANEFRSLNAHIEYLLRAAVRKRKGED